MSTESEFKMSSVNGPKWVQKLAKSGVLGTKVGENGPKPTFFTHFRPTSQGRKRNPNPNFLVRIFSGGVGVFHTKGWGPKSSVCPSKPGKSNFFGGISRDFAGISRGCPKSLRKKVWVQFSFPNFVTLTKTHFKPTLRWKVFSKKGPEAALTQHNSRLRLTATLLVPGTMGKAEEAAKQTVLQRGFAPGMKVVLRAGLDKGYNSWISIDSAS